ncbi:MAG TPA: chemotaxis protein CheB [Sphingobacteriaceae bacterium]|nr:chemotaxis protein CheB [Sphingobacteriaceae bacterium]
MIISEPHHIIAIGASAGGMEEINSFFDHTPLDGVSYVIVQHLSPAFKSRMVELLAKHSKLEVKEAETGMEVKSNQVYLIPNDKFMTIKDQRLLLTDKDKVPGPHLTINKFFNSLADDMGRKAIGVVLSGLGSDGSEGVRNIKNSGGMVIARNPETSEFSSMPSNAIATGMVDFILEPELMPGTIEDYVKHESELLPEDKDDGKNLAAIIDLIKEHSPFDFSDYKQTTILRRTKRRAAYSNFTSLESYFHFLKKTPEEVETLAKDFLIGVTAFFRDPQAFNCIEQQILPDLLERLHPGEEFKLWVAGCATGEEAYTIAILVFEQIAKYNKDVVVKIFATDIDNTALIHAGKGIYTSESIKNISKERLEKYFINEDGIYRIIPEIRKMLMFSPHDLVKNPPYCNMHFISCRNLLIYMTPALQKKIYLMFLFGLKLDGYLFLGPSENPIPIIENLEIVEKKWKIYKNLDAKRVIRFDAFSLPELKYKPSEYIKEDRSKDSDYSLIEAVNSTLVRELNFLVICVDETNHVVKSYGDTSKFLLQKNFNTNLTELLPPQLAVAFNTASINAIKTNSNAKVNGITIKKDQTSISVNLSVRPLITKRGAQRMLMVTISEKAAEAHGQQGDTVFDERLFLDEYTLNLQEEVKELQDKLHSSQLQVDVSNENMQSFNEELLSANEEMQSSNEEMQSVNEELHTINTDYQLKNKELVEVNDDLNNYFRSNINGQLFVNNDLELMKYSPGTTKQINLLPSDIGRPLSNISTNIKFETILDDIKQVLANGVILTKEIETNNHKWYQIMTMPYIQQANNKPNGAIITFNDITELKKTLRELDSKNESLLRINADLDNFVHTASHDLLAPLSNIESSISVINRLKVTDPDLNKFLGIINSSVKKFRDLIKEIATIAKLESEMIAHEMVDLDVVINNIEWSLTDKINASGAIIHRNLEVEQVLFSKKNLRSIVYNLVSNGIKFKRDEPSVINIHTRKEGDYVILSVEDNGIGIPKRLVDSIFEMYGRLNQDIEGHGIGLYLAKKIVDSSGGNIIVESKPGKGSKFSIYLKA